MKRSRGVDNLEKSGKLSKLETEDNEALTDEEEYEKEIIGEEEENQATEETVTSTYNELMKLDQSDKNYEILKNSYIQDFEFIYNTKKSNLSLNLIKLVLNFIKLIKFKDYGVEIKDKIQFNWLKLSLDIVLWSLDLKTHHNMRGISNDPDDSNEDDEDDEDNEDNVNILSLPKPLKLELQRIEASIDENLKNIDYEEELQKDEGFEEFLHELEALGTDHFTSYYPEIRIKFTNLFNFNLFKKLINNSNFKFELKFELIRIWFNISQNNFENFDKNLIEFKEQCEICVKELDSLISNELEINKDSLDKDRMALWYEQLGHLYLLEINFFELKEGEVEEDLETKILKNFVKSSENFEKSLKFNFNENLLKFLEHNALSN